MLTKSFALELKDLTEAGVFTGYASVYGNKDSYGDIVMPGAFTKTIQSRPVVKILYQHDPRMPIGKGKLEDSEVGLIVHAQLTMGVAKAQEAYALLKDRVLDELSIGYWVPPGGEQYDKGRDANLLTELDLREVSPVSFASNPLARVTGVKDRAAIESIRDFEDFLRDAGFSRKEAAALASGGWKGLQRDADEPDIAKLQALIQLRTAELTRRFHTWN
jgi:hypothetical protein